VICHFKNILLNLGANILLMAIILKTWRLHRIFNRSKLEALKTVRISNVSLLQWLVLTLAIDILILAVWWGASPFDIVPRIYKCSSEAEPWIHAPLWAWKLAFGIGLVWLTYEVRDIDERFNESRWLQMAIYNVASGLAVLIILTVALDNIPPRMWMVMFDTIVYYLALSTFILIFFPKFYRIWMSDREYEDLYGSSIAEDVEEATDVLEKEKKQEQEEAVQKKKGFAEMTDDEKMAKLHSRRAKKARDLQKLLKIVDRSKQRMKTDIANLNTLSSDVLALQQEIEYRGTLMTKQGKQVKNEYTQGDNLGSLPPSDSPKQDDVEMHEVDKGGQKEYGGDSSPKEDGGGGEEDRL